MLSLLLQEARHDGGGLTSRLLAQHTLPDVPRFLEVPPYLHRRSSIFLAKMHLVVQRSRWNVFLGGLAYTVVSCSNVRARPLVLAWSLSSAGRTTTWSLLFSSGRISADRGGEFTPL